MSSDQPFQTLVPAPMRWRSAIACLVAAIVIALAVAVSIRHHVRARVGELHRLAAPVAAQRFVRIGVAVVRTDHLTDMLYQGESPDVGEHKLSIYLEGKDEITLHGQNADRGWADIQAFLQEQTGHH